MRNRYDPILEYSKNFDIDIRDSTLKKDFKNVSIVSYVHHVCLLKRNTYRK